MVRWRELVPVLTRLVSIELRNPGGALSSWARSAALIGDPSALKMSLSEIFLSADLDRSGELDLFEFEQALEASGLGLRHEEAVAVMAMADTDHDGLVSYREFLAAAPHILEHVVAQMRHDEHSAQAVSNAQRAAAASEVAERLATSRGVDLVFTQPGGETGLEFVSHCAVGIGSTCCVKGSISMPGTPPLDNISPGMVIVAVNHMSVLECTYQEVLSMASSCLRPLHLRLVQLPGSHVGSGAALDAVAKARQIIDSRRDETKQKHVDPSPVVSSLLDHPVVSSGLSLFREWDKNGDNSLSHSELKKALKKDARFKKILASEGFHWKDVWSTYDSTGTGLISQGEFIRFYQQVLSPPPHAAVEASVDPSYLHHRDKRRVQAEAEEATRLDSAKQRSHLAAMEAMRYEHEALKAAMCEKHGHLIERSEDLERLIVSKDRLLMKERAEHKEEMRVQKKAYSDLEAEHRELMALNPAQGLRPSSPPPIGRSKTPSQSPRGSGTPQSERSSAGSSPRRLSKRERIQAEKQALASMVHSASKSSMIDAIQRANEDSVRSIASALSKEAHANMAGVDGEFLAMDLNHDGVIDKEEWIAWETNSVPPPARAVE